LPPKYTPRWTLPFLVSTIVILVQTSWEVRVPWGISSHTQSKGSP
jgi:hypothetical protein